MDSQDFVAKVLIADEAMAPEDDCSEAVRDLLNEGFRIHDDASANWLIRQIIERRLYAERCQKWCDREQIRAKREEEFFVFTYGPQLRAYAQAKIEAVGGRRKSLNLPAGTVGFRTETEKLVIDDEQAVMQWAKRFYPHFVIATERLSKSSVIDHLKQTGEMPSTGAHIEPAREKFYVK